jgi:class 3 adenylate cyclase/tetratricopeptide (TPR) repeat protein
MRGMRCPACGEDNPERAKFCLNCGAPLDAAQQQGGETRKVVTIVFADMAGSTAIGERLDPEALRRVQARYFDDMTAVLERHGGTVEKYIGDAVMAVFGIPRLHEDDALRAVRSATEMQTAIERSNEELQRDYGVRIAIRIGVNTGEVVSSEQHGDQRLVTGDTVNVAARLEQAAGAGEVLLGETTYRLVRDAVQVQPIEPLDLKGKTDRVPAFRLLEVLADVAGHVRHLDSPMVGRSRELELFHRALERTHDDRTSHLFTLLGPAGVGKSRLVREFLDHVGDATVLQGRCLSYGEGITYYALNEIVRSAASIAEADDDTTALRKLSGLLADAEDGDRIARLVGGLFAWAEPSTADDAAWGVRKLFEHLARERPLVVVMDDVHWAEPLFQDMIEYLADWTRDAEVLLVCVARPELLEIRAGWGGGKMNATSILLEPLAGDEATTLLDNLLGDAALPGAARERILAAAEGNPLFVEEMIGMLIDDGLLRFEDGSWRSVDDLADLTVPPTIQLLLAARLDRLDAEERAVIERGAVEGKVFHTGAVTSLSAEGQRTSVRPRLLALARKELIRPDRAEFVGEDAFRFRHLLIRDAAYQAMPKEQRAELHEGFARWLTSATGDKVDDYQEILGHHLEQAFRYRSELGPLDDRARGLSDEAAASLRRSAEHTLERNDLNGAIRFLERAIEVASGEELALALVELGELREQMGDYHASIESLDRFAAMPEAAALPGPALRARVFSMVSVGMTSPEVGVEASERKARELLKEAEALGDPGAIRAATLVTATMAFYRGHCAEAREISARLLPEIGSMNPVYRSLVTQTIGTDAYFGSVPVHEAFSLVDQIREILGEGPLSQIRGDGILAGLTAMSGDTDGFFELKRNVDRGWEELGNPGNWRVMGQTFAECAWILGKYDEAEAMMREVKTYLDDAGEIGNNSTVTGVLATFLVEAGRFDEAAELVEQARAMTVADDFGATVPIRWADAMLASARGDHGAAIAAIDEAVATVRTTDYLNFTADTLRVRGQVQWSAGRIDEASASFDEAARLWEHKENVASPRRMQAWRDEHGA